MYLISLPSCYTRDLMISSVPNVIIGVSSRRISKKVPPNFRAQIPDDQCLPLRKSHINVCQCLLSLIILLLDWFTLIIFLIFTYNTKWKKIKSLCSEWTFSFKLPESIKIHIQHIQVTFSMTSYRSLRKKWYECTQNDMKW